MAFTDDDCRPARGWLAAFARRFSVSPNHVLGGKVANGVPGNRYSMASQLILDIVYRHYNSDPERARFFGSANVSMATSVFRDLGGFDAQFRTASEDREFCDRCRFRGVPMAFVPDAVVEHMHELTFSRFCRQHFNYGRGACDFHDVQSGRGSGTMCSEMTFHLNAQLDRRAPPPGRVARSAPAGRDSGIVARQLCCWFFQELFCANWRGALVGRDMKTIKIRFEHFWKTFDYRRDPPGVSLPEWLLHLVEYQGFGLCSDRDHRADL